METDADRREMLLSLGGSDSIMVKGRVFSAALFEDEQRDVVFEDGVTVNAHSPTLTCLSSEIRVADVRAGDIVEKVPEYGSQKFRVAKLSHNAGMCVLDLRKD